MATLPMANSWIAVVHADGKLDQKKGAQLPPLWTTLLAPDLGDPTSTILELDERMARLCSPKRTTPGFGWPSVAGDGKWSPLRLGIGAGKTCQRLWKAIPEGYRQGHCETSFWAAYAAVIPQEHHPAVGPRDRRNGPRGALEHHPAPTAGPFWAHDLLVFQVGADA
jgi:hypothetical protein